MFTYYTLYPYGSRQQAGLSMPGSEYTMHTGTPKTTKKEFYLQGYVSDEE